MIINVKPYSEFANNADFYTKIISITEPGRIIKQRDNNHLVISMWDLDKELKNSFRTLEIPNKNEVIKAIEFAKSFKQDDIILIHCAAGESRSPAIAYGVAWFLTHDKEEVRYLLRAILDKSPNLAIMKIWREYFNDFPF